DQQPRRRVAEREAIADDVVARQIFNQWDLQGPVLDEETGEIDADRARHRQIDVIGHPAVETGDRTLQELRSAGVRAVGCNDGAGKLQVRTDMDRVARHDDTIGGLQHYGIALDAGEVDRPTRAGHRYVLAGHAVAGDIEAGAQQHFAARLDLADSYRVLLRDV